MSMTKVHAAEKPKRGSREWKKEPSILQCEYRNCHYIAAVFRDFIFHVEIHFSDFLPKGFTAENYNSEEFRMLEEQLHDEYHCHWSDCDFCAETPRDLIRHMYFHAFHTKIKYEGTRAAQRANLPHCQLEDTHRNTIQTLPNPFQCFWADCQYQTDNMDSFIGHVNHHPEQDQTDVIETDDGKKRPKRNGRPKSRVNKASWDCKWEGCTCSTGTIYKLKEHLRTHTTEKLYACQQCGNLFSNRTKFFDHLERQQDLEAQKFQCSHCSRIFANERLLRDHVRKHVNRYKCHLCEMTCPAPANLRNHLRWRHSHERSFMCDICDLRCGSKCDLAKHMLVHDAVPAYNCVEDNCNYTSRSLMSLRRHFQKEHLKEPLRYSCHVCEKKFTQGGHLSNHLKDVHKFKWPSGHSRFRYKEHEDGIFRLQTQRYESLELTMQSLQNGEEGLIVDNQLDVMTENENIQTTQSDTNKRLDCKHRKDRPQETENSQKVHLVLGGNGATVQYEDGQVILNQPVPQSYLPAQVQDSQQRGSDTSYSYLTFPSQEQTNVQGCDEFSEKQVRDTANLLLALADGRGVPHDQNRAPAVEGFSDIQTISPCNEMEHSSPSRKLNDKADVHLGGAYSDTGNDSQDSTPSLSNHKYEYDSSPAHGNFQCSVRDVESVKTSEMTHDETNQTIVRVIQSIQQAVYREPTDQSSTTHMYDVHVPLNTSDRAVSSEATLHTGTNSQGGSRNGSGEADIGGHAKRNAFGNLAEDVDIHQHILQITPSKSIHEATQNNSNHKLQLSSVRKNLNCHFAEYSISSTKSVAENSTRVDFNEQTPQNESVASSLAYKVTEMLQDVQATLSSVSSNLEEAGSPEAFKPPSHINSNQVKLQGGGAAFTSILQSPTTWESNIQIVEQEIVVESAKDDRKKDRCRKRKRDEKKVKRGKKAKKKYDLES